MYTRHKTGRKGEKHAVEFLKQHGYSIITQNYRGKVGEIDIIAQEGSIIVFVEVKTRTSDVFGRPAEAIGRKKLHGIIQTAYLFLREKNLESADFRIDALEVFISNNSEKIEHLKNITL